MSQEALFGVLRDVREKLALPENDFAWSHWRNQSQALAEIDRLLNAIASGGRINRSSLEVLFAPTGSLQEVSISSGWGEEFLQLASRLDAAVADL